MFIEVYLSGQFLCRSQVRAYENLNVRRASWEKKVIAKEKLLKMYVEHFLKSAHTILNKHGKIDLYVVFESKVNGITIPDDEMNDFNKYVDDKIM